MLVMRQIVHVTRKNDIEKEKIQTLKLELDYQLASLFDAMNSRNEKEMEDAKKCLSEIHHLLGELNAFE